MSYLVNVANVASMSQPNACIGGGLHAPILFEGGAVHMPGLAYETGASMYNRLGGEK